MSKKITIRSCSIERVINTSTDMVGRIAKNVKNHDTAQVNYEDWLEAKPVVCAMWSAVWNALFIETFPRPDRETDYQRALAEHFSHKYELRKGDPNV
jgi:hypothetical protein